MISMSRSSSVRRLRAVFARDFATIEARDAAREGEALKPSEGENKAKHTHTKHFEKL